MRDFRDKTYPLLKQAVLRDFVLRQFALMLANLITFAHRSVSSTMSLWNSAGDIIKIGLPKASSAS